MSDDCLYVPDGDLYVPTEHTRGPWDPRAQHGGAPAALLAHCVEQVEAPLPMDVARITVELLRPVPVESPVRVQTRVTRPGRKVQLVEAVMAQPDGTELCRAVALRIRHEDVSPPVRGVEHVEPPLPPASGRAQPGIGGDRAFAVTGVELRFVRGIFLQPGAATVWIRLRMPVVPGETPSGMQRACAAADFGNGVSSVHEWGRTLFINPDLTVALARQPEGEWICIDAVTHPGPHGRALAESRLFDLDGVVGRSLQCLLVEPL
ncbi:MAG TPA: thioesterase family protein [Candidatus Dormibacteraeota bacterium]|nr:thioesterase family protein [Candidatus Dormibacteraeota bacterium]